MQRPRLVASDVDGTLLGLNARASRRTVDVVARIVAAGVPFVLVTGRPPRWIQPVVDEIGHAGLAVCANGAVLYDAATGEVLSTRTLDAMRLHDLADSLTAALPGCMFAAERIADPHAPAQQDFVAELGYAHPWPGPDHHEAPRDELLGRPAVKLLVRHPDMTSEAMAAAVDGLVDDTLSVTFSTGNGLLEFAAAGVDKSTGLAAVADHYGVARADVIAFGDMPNDLEMLAWAGHGVAMGDGHPSVLEVADEVTAPVSEDGVPLVLERWF